MRYMRYASGQYVMSIDEAEDISEIRESASTHLKVMLIL